MKRLVAIAVRNLLRNRRRTALTGASVLVGVTFVVFLTGFFNGFIQAIIRGTVETQIGAVQVHRKGFLDASSDPLKKDMSDDLAATIKSVPGVIAVAPRLNFDGFANNGTSSSVFSAVAIDPASEYEVCPKRDESTHGQRFSKIDEAKAFLGEELAKGLDLKSGGSLSLLSATPKGNQNALDADVAGEIHLNIPFAGKRALVTTLGFAQSLLRMPHRVTEYAVSIGDLQQAEIVAKAVQEKLGDDYEVITWRQRDQNASDAVDRLTAVVLIISIVFFVLILSGIINTMLMSVYERVREIGTMLAVGVRRWQVLIMFLVEALTLGFFAALIGSSIGASVVLGLAKYGITVTPPGQKPMPIFPFITPSNIAIAMLATSLGAMLAALYPALRASRLKPVDALRAN